MTTEVRAPTAPIYLAGEFVEEGTPLEVRNPATDALIATTFQAGPEQLERATQAAVSAFERTKRLASFERRDALAHVAQRMTDVAVRAELGDRRADLLLKPSAQHVVYRRRRQATAHRERRRQRALVDAQHA